MDDWCLLSVLAIQYSWLLIICQVGQCWPVHVQYLQAVRISWLKAASNGSTAVFESRIWVVTVLQGCTIPYYGQLRPCFTVPEVEQANLGLGIIFRCWLTLWYTVRLLRAEERMASMSSIFVPWAVIPRSLVQKKLHVPCDIDWLLVHMLKSTGTRTLP